ncbi:MAG: substrate-binding domain-containing protein [Lachnospiraceae bacterium]|nr:substrate-binding domain-containing protein [Lachnospiraceae bacterium]
MAVKYKWLAAHLEAMIQKNIRKGINQMPTEQALCEKYQLSRQTVRMALKTLEEKGLIEKKQGSGSFITGRSPNSLENTVGILLFNDQDYLYPGVLQDIRNVLSDNGFSAMTFSTGNSVLQERTILQSLQENPPRGLIVEGCKSALPNPNLDLYRKLMKKDCEILFLYNHYPQLSDCLFVKDDNFSGSALLVQHLAAQGHSRIGGIFKIDDMQGSERYQGFMETLRDLNLPMSDNQVCWYDSHDLQKMMNTGDTAFLQRMVQEALSFCTAVVCYNDILAYHLVDVLLQSGYHLPQEMAVTAFDNTYLSNSDILTITTLSHLPHEMGTRAAVTLLNKWKGLPVHSQEVRWNLNQKESTHTT